MRRRTLLAGAGALAGCAALPDLGNDGARKPLIIAHRGASGDRPEHTMLSYRLAIAQGADVIEPDLVLTQDGQFVCRHENEISGTTDVADHPEFADRRRTKVIDGETLTGWFTEDFTLAELRTLRCKERLPQLRPGNAYFDGQDVIPTFADVLRLALDNGVGICPELKHPTHFLHAGQDMTTEFLDVIASWRREHAGPRIYVQCFETEPLRRMADLGSFSNVDGVQLIAAEGGPVDQPQRSYAQMLSDEGLREIARYAGIIAVDKTLILPRDAAGASQPPTDLIARAHAANLRVFAWTFRAENNFLPRELRRGDPQAADYLRARGDIESELVQFAALGIDGVFTDFTAPAVAVFS